MSASDLDLQLQRIIAQGIDEHPSASPSDLVRWTRDKYGSVISLLERKLADDRLLFLYLAEMGRRRKSSESRPEPESQGRPEPFRPDEAHFTDPIGRKVLDKKGRPRFGHPQQNRLPFSEQFERIPYYMILEPRTRQKRGKEIELPNATLADLKKRRALIRGEQSTELPQLNRLIQIMQAYDKMQPGITVKKALELRSTARRGDKQA